MALAGEEQLTAALTTDGLKEAIQKAQRCLMDLQKPSGDWCGELEGDSILESEYILLMHSIGKGRAPLTLKVAAYLRKIQTPGGGWQSYPGGPDDVSSTVKAYFALKLAGDSPDAPHMRHARESALRLGGVCATNTFTKIYLALFGQYEWQHVPAIPPEIVLLPRWFYFNIYAMSSWSRTILVPLAVIWHHRPYYVTPPDCRIDELFVGGRENADPALRTSYPFPSWKHVFLLVDRGLKFLDQLPIKPWRRRALQVAERWIKDRFRKSAGLGAIFPPIVNSVWALLCLGYNLESAEVQGQLRELYALVIEEEDDARVQPCTSPVWDTALSCIALEESGLAPVGPAFEAAYDWLVEHEVTEPGDWRIQKPNLQPGGWYFEYANEFYPDIDDTAMVLIALARRGPKGPMEQRALDWLMGMECTGGGWASFDADNDRSLLCEFPFADHNAMIDPPTADITGRMLEMLSAYGYNERNAPVQRAIQFLRNEQEPDGSWFGRWGVNYIYGTWQVLKGLSSIGVHRDDPMVAQGVKWLLSVQNPDGGWGEGCNSYDDPEQRGRGESTASQTAWALMGLVAAGQANNSAVELGVEFLLKSQNMDGDWTEDHFTGTGFPRVFYLKYHLYRLYFPLFALGMYMRAIRGGNQALHQAGRKLTLVN